MSQRPCVFVVRHHNDVDHMMPVAVTYLEHQVGPVHVVLAGDGLQSHPLIELVAQRGGLVGTLSRALGADEGEPIERLRKEYAAGELTLVPWLDRVGEDFVMCLDWDYTRFGKRTADETRALGGVSVSLPHGDAPYTNLMITLDDITGRMKAWYRRAEMFDHTVVPNYLCAKRYPNLPPDRLHVLGSPRYNRIWLERLGQFDAGNGTLPDVESPRVALFLRNHRFPIHWEELVRAIDIIIASGPVELILKHHTRAKELELLLSRFPNLANPGPGGRYRSIHEEVSSVEIVRWADIVIDTGTSVAFEAVVKRLPVLELEYVHANRSTIAHYFSNTELLCRDDLVDALANLKAEPFGGYSDATWLRFLNEVVEPAGPDVLAGYVELLQRV